MNVIASVLLRWTFSETDIVLVLYVVTSIFLVYLLIRFLIAGRHLLETLTVYFQQRTENEKRKPDEK